MLTRGVSIMNTVGTAYSSKKGKPINMLSMEQVYRLYDWMKEQKGMGKLHGMTRIEIADVASKNLGFTVTLSNVSNPARALGLFNTTAPGQSSRNAKNKRRLLTMAREIVKIQKALGMSLNAELEYMVNDSHYKE